MDKLVERMLEKLNSYLCLVALPLLFVTQQSMAVEQTLFFDTNAGTLEWRASTLSGVRIASGEQDVCVSPTPIEIEVADHNGVFQCYTATYESLLKKTINQRLTVEAKGSISTPAGSVFTVTDYWWAEPENALFGFERKVVVSSAGEADYAFNSRLRLADPHGVDVGGYDVFIPAIWYKDNEGLLPKALAYHQDDDAIYVREDRLPLPLVMLYSQDTGSAVSLLHRNPDGRTSLVDRDARLKVDAAFKFGSIGVNQEAGAAATFIYPGSEGERNYFQPVSDNETTKRWARRCHPVKTWVSHTYQLAVTVQQADEFSVAVKDAWRWAYDLFAPAVLTVDLDNIYDINIDILDQYWAVHDGATGFPFSVAVWDFMDDDSRESYVSGDIVEEGMWMGFVGQQLPCAAMMIRHGVKRGNASIKQKGVDIVDFWADNSMTVHGFPHTRWKVSPPAGWRTDPIKIRTVCEGMEGMLHAWRILDRQGEFHPAWIQACLTFGDWLVSEQNADGSYYREYSVFTGNATHTGKQISNIPVRFLCRLYDVTRDVRYLNAALAAGEYSYANEYKTGTYIGGVADNPNVRDRSACLISIEANLALYDTTHERKWLKAALRAADYGETWLYCWDVPRVDGQEGNVFPEGRKTTGLSIIATGHSASDTVMSYFSHSYLRLYELTGDEHYFDISQQILHNTKQTLDYDGSLGYAHPALHGEAGSLVPAVRGRNVGVWLPWQAAAMLLPLASAEDEYGSVIAHWNFEEGLADALVPGPPVDGGYSGMFKDVSGNSFHASPYTGEMYAYRGDVSASVVSKVDAVNRFSVQNISENGSLSISTTGTGLTNWNPRVWTIEFVAKWDGTGGTLGKYRTVVGRAGTDVYESDPGQAPLHIQHAGTRWKAHFVDSAGNYWSMQSAEGAVKSNHWQAVALVSNGSTASLYMRDITGGDRAYKLLCSVDISSSADPSLAIGNGDGADWNAGDFIFGQGLKNGARLNRFHGFMDDIRFSEIALSNGDFLYDGSNSRSLLKAHWNFEEGLEDAMVPGPAVDGGYSGVFKDVSGNSCHASPYTGNLYAYHSDVASAGVPQINAVNRLSIQTISSDPVLSISTVGTGLANWNPSVWTIEFSAKWDGSGGTHRTVIGRAGTDVNADDPGLAPLHIQHEGTRWKVHFVDGAGNYWSMQSAEGFVVANHWQAVSVVCNGLTVSLCMKDITAGDATYQLLCSMDIAASTDPSLSVGNGDGADWNAGDFMFGRGLRDGVRLNSFLGHIDEIRFSETALTSGEFLYDARGTSGPISGMKNMGNGRLEMTINAPSPTDSYLMWSTNLSAGVWDFVPHSDSPTGPFTHRNLAYPPLTTTNTVLYVSANEKVAFFKTAQPNQ
jgi:hypothetical protein